MIDAQHDLDVLTAAHAIKTGATHKALLLSAKQWVTAAKERAFEMYYGPPNADHIQGLAYVQTALVKALMALHEADEALTEMAGAK